jgi:electron-transferring-flavoprotein dehydrogenase
VGVRSGDKGRGKEGEELRNFEPGSDITAKATVLAEGCWGHLTGAAIGEFDLGEGREPHNWELGVKEVWKVPKPLDRVIHTIGPWPLKLSTKYHHTGGSWLYPMKHEKTGEDMVSIGFVVDLDYADATTSVHDLLQQFKLHPLVRGILDGGERVAWGAKALPAAATGRCPSSPCRAPSSSATPGGMVNTTALKGLHYAIKAGMLAAESIYAALRRGETSLASYEEAVDDSVIGKELWEVRNTRQPLAQKGLIKGGPLTNVLIATKGRFPGGRLHMRRSDETPMFIGDTSKGYPKPDGKYTFDKLSSVYITGNATRDDAPNHIRVQKHVPLTVAETWRSMCPRASTRSPRSSSRGPSRPTPSTSSSTTRTACSAGRSRRRAAG